MRCLTRFAAVVYATGGPIAVLCSQMSCDVIYVRHGEAEVAYPSNSLGRLVKAL